MAIMNDSTHPGLDLRPCYARLCRTAPAGSIPCFPPLLLRCVADQAEIFRF